MTGVLIMKIRFFSLLALLWAGSLVAAAQSPIVGTWVLTTADKLLPPKTTEVVGDLAYCGLDCGSEIEAFFCQE